MDTLFQMVGAGFILTMGLMSLLWVVYLFRRNAGIVDIGWALSFFFLVWIYFFLGHGLFLRKVLIAVLVSLWSLRLAYYLTERYMRHPEDPRYQQLRQKWGEENSKFNFLRLFLFQGLIALFLSLPFLLISLNQRSWSKVEWIGVFVWLCGVIGESIADYQLQKFKNEDKEDTKVCKSGLWNYSRHPNYFFEWVVWIGYFLIALAAPMGWLAIMAPVIMYYLLTQVSGIPMNEAEALKTKGPAYGEYQRTTSSFFPWFPKT